MRERMLMILLYVLACDAGDDDNLADTGESGSEADESTTDGERLDADAVLAQALQFREDLEQVTDVAQASQHGLADTVHVWIDAGASASYRALDPTSDEGTDVAFPPGTLFVKEHLDGDGVGVGLTIMFRGPDGYAPDSADWWWGRTDEAGVLQDEGQVGFCIGCHAGANAEAFVFGVSTDNQTAR